LRVPDDQLLHQVTVAASPFAYSSYAEDIVTLEHIHPLALYRRLAERSLVRQAPKHEFDTWVNCMTQWAEEQAIKEKSEASPFISSQSPILIL
jgi:hypothetical protein